MQNKVILCVENNKSIKDIKLCNADVCDIFYFNENMSIEAIEQNLRKDENLNLIVYTSTRDRSYDVIKCLVGGGVL